MDQPQSNFASNLAKCPKCGSEEFFVLSLQREPVSFDLDDDIVANTDDGHLVQEINVECTQCDWTAIKDLSFPIAIDPEHEFRKLGAEGIRNEFIEVLKSMQEGSP